MKIIFICGSLERGKDGVGDYTRRLASGLIAIGCDVRMLALNDKHLVGFLHEVQLEQDQQITTLRLGKDLGWKERAVRAKVWVDAFNPSWLSLQYVPYAFQDKGLPFFLGRYLKEIGGDRKWHVMFHELCIGLEINSSIKYEVIGYLQRKMIRFLIYYLKVERISTQCKLYKKILYDLIAKDIQLLPLFSNIEKAVFPGVIRKNERLVVFGWIHKCPSYFEFIQSVKSNFGKKAELIFLGRNGFELQNWVKACESIGVDYKVMGEVSATEVSKILQTCQYGISTTPAPVLEKSSSFAAYKNHDLMQINVSSVRYKSKYKHPKENFKIWNNNIDWSKVRQQKEAKVSTNEIANLFKAFLE